MVNGFWSSLIATILTCVLLLSLMSAGLVQVVLEKKKHLIINSFIIAGLAAGLAFSLIVLMYPAGQAPTELEDLSRVDVPSTIFVDDGKK